MRPPASQICRNQSRKNQQFRGIPQHALHRKHLQRDLTAGQGSADSDATLGGRRRASRASARRFRASGAECRNQNRKRFVPLALLLLALAGCKDFAREQADNPYVRDACRGLLAIATLPADSLTIAGRDGGRCAYWIGRTLNHRDSLRLADSATMRP